MDGVKHIFLVLSGKGGVGKSSVSAQLAMTLYSQNYSVGILDVDLCGPSIPKMFRLQKEKIHQTSNGWLPVYWNNDKRLSVMSIAFLLPNQDDSVVWRGPKKNSMIKQFLESVDWGNLDYLIIDTPPGTSDEHMAIVEYLQAKNPTAIIVTTPQLVAVEDVEKEISFCKTVNVPIDGIIENMSGYICPHCSECSNVFSSGGGEQLAQSHNLEFLGKLPIYPKVARLLEGKASSSTGEPEPSNLVEAYKQTELYPLFLKMTEKLHK